MVARRVSALALALAVAASLTACADEDAGAASTGGTAPTGGTGSTASNRATGPTGGTDSTGSTGGTVPPGTDLEDGRHFGYVESVDDDANVVGFDLASFLSGEAATEAAQERGDEAPPPNDYYIVNDNPRLRSLPLSSVLEIVLINWERCCDETLSPDLATFAQVIAAGDDGLDLGGHHYLGTASTYWLTIEDGAVVSIEEQYLP